MSRERFLIIKSELQFEDTENEFIDRIEYAEGHMKALTKHMNLE